LLFLYLAVFNRIFEPLHGALRRTRPQRVYVAGIDMSQNPLFFPARRARPGARRPAGLTPGGPAIPNDALDGTWGSEADAGIRRRYSRHLRTSISPPREIARRQSRGRC